MFTAAFAAIKAAGSSIKFYAILVTIVLAIALFGYFGVKYQSALAHSTELEQAKLKLEEANQTLNETNVQNQKFIADMKADTAFKDKLVSDFRIQKARDDKQLDDLRRKIQAAPTSEDGPVAKVLRDALIGISPAQPGDKK